MSEHEALRERVAAALWSHRTGLPADLFGHLHPWITEQYRATADVALAVVLEDARR